MTTKYSREPRGNKKADNLRQRSSTDRSRHGKSWAAPAHKAGRVHKAFFWVNDIAEVPRFTAGADWAEMMSGSDCAQVLSIKTWVSKLQLLVDFEISQTDVSDLDDNVLFRSPAST